MAIPKYVQEFQDFSLEKISELGKTCYFCDSEQSVFVFYLLTNKNHKKERLHMHPNHAKYYYPTCQVCMQGYARARDKFMAGLVRQGISYMQSDQYLSGKLDEFLKMFQQGDISSFKQFLTILSTDEVKYVPNFDQDPVVQLLPGLAAQLTQSELQLAISRIKAYQEEFLFNASSDYIVLLSVVMQEIRLQRMMSKMLSSKSSEKNEFLQKDYTDLMKEYRENLAALGVLRRERDKIGGTNIAEIADLIGDENQVRVDMEAWDDELVNQLNNKKKRDEDMGYYE